MQFLKGVEEYKFMQQIIWYEMVKNVHTKIYMYIPVYTWTSFVITVLLLSSMFRTQTALEEEQTNSLPRQHHDDPPQCSKDKMEQ